MEDTKKRGRPAAAPKNAGESAGETAVPKKRGRPSKAPKVKKPPSGRGRGRPKTVGAAKASDGEDGAVNGAGESVSAASGVGRGRGKKGKVSQPIEATGKGRGRAKNPPKSDQDDKEEEEDEDEDGDDDDDEDDEDDSTVKDSGGSGGKAQKLAGKRGGNAKAPKIRGRPKKPVDSEDLDEESDDNKEPQEKKILGRPPTGAVSLKIVATGRGQGRPKKDVNGSLVPKRGRKAGSKIKLPTGRSRGRPSAIAKSSDSDNSQDDDQGSQSDEEDQTKPEIVQDKKVSDGDDSVVFNGTEEEDDEDDQQQDDDSVDLPAAKLTKAA